MEEEFEHIKIRYVKSLKDFALFAYSMQSSLLFYETHLEICNMNPVEYDADVPYPLDMYLTEDEDRLCRMEENGELYDYVKEIKSIIYNSKASSVTVCGNLVINPEIKIMVKYTNSSEGQTECMYTKEFDDLYIAEILMSLVKDMKLNKERYELTKAQKNI